MCSTIMSIGIFASLSLNDVGEGQQSRSVLGLRHEIFPSMSTDAKIVMKHIQRVSLRCSIAQAAAQKKGAPEPLEKEVPVKGADDER